MPKALTTTADYRKLLADIRKEMERELGVNSAELGTQHLIDEAGEQGSFPVKVGNLHIPTCEYSHIVVYL